jgi:hypothetical protein
VTRVRAVDRVVVLLVGLALVAAGALVLDFSLEVVASHPDRLDVSRVRDLVDSEWWAWSFAGASVVLGLLALAWLVAHLGGRSDGRVRLSPSGPAGRLVVELESVAAAAADQVASLAPVSRARGSVIRGRSGSVLCVRAHVAGHADVATLAAAAERVGADVASAFPHDDVGFRLVLDGPRAERSVIRRRDVVRVREE